jgi:hypothetical protein
VPKSLIGQAIAYTLSNREALVRYAQDGDLEIDNNGAERSLRGIAYNLGNLAAAGAAEADRRLVADQLAATAGEDRRQAGQARAVLLADAGRSHLTRRLFGAMVRRIAALPGPTG